MTCRTLQECDIERVRRFAKADGSLQGRNNDEFWSEDQLKAVVASGRHATAVAKIGSCIHGFAFAVVIEDLKIAYIHDFIYNPSFRNKGVRERLLDVIDEELAKRGVVHKTIIGKVGDMAEDQRFLWKRKFFGGSHFCLYGCSVPALGALT